MIKKLPILFVWFSVFFLPAAGFAQGEDRGVPGIVSAPLANVHEESASKQRIVTQVLMGDEVQVREKQDNRYRITIKNQEQREGWIQQEAVLIPKDKGRFYLNDNREWIVITKPKSEALILDKTGNHNVSLYAGTRLPVIQTTPKGHRVQFPDKSEAIVPVSDAGPVKSSDPLLNETKPEELARTAMRFTNIIHIAGGISAQGMDTEGLIYTTYRVHGIPLSTDRASFTTKADRVAKSDLEPGDILVFRGNNLGLFLGDGAFIQVLKKKGSRISSIADRRSRKELQHGLRIIGAGLNPKKDMAAMTADEIGLIQTRLAGQPIGKRIAYWAGRFIGTPYDPDPLGHYVRSNRIVADEKADCMYHTFRAVELAQTSSPEESVKRALNLRFLSQGKIQDGLVVNYDDRFQYGEDMVMSGKWGKNVTADLGETERIAGSRGRETVDILPKRVLAGSALQKQLRDGDIVYWVKNPEKRVVGEIVAHISIIHITSGTPHLIHASGDKDRKDKPGGGVVKEVPFEEYVEKTRFIGAFVTRFE